jgi:hypothetical protein
MPELKNETFIANITDPRTGRQVKKIYQIKVSKIGRLVEPMVWEYYKNRANMSVGDIYKKFNGYQLKFIYFGDPVIYKIDTLTTEQVEQNTNLPKNSTLKKKDTDNLNMLVTISEENSIISENSNCPEMTKCEENKDSNIPSKIDENIETKKNSSNESKKKIFSGKNSKYGKSNKSNKYNKNKKYDRNDNGSKINVVSIKKTQ